MDSASGPKGSSVVDLDGTSDEVGHDRVPPDVLPPSTPTLSTSGPNYTPDKFFYFLIVAFRVGSTIFRVPRHGFEVPGTVFEALFSLPPVSGDAEGVEGLSDEHPIVLDGVDEDHFRGFLGALYPFVKDMAYSDWVGALHLATMWEFREIRAKAISAISLMLPEKNAAEVVLLAKKYRVSNWLKDAYTRLVEQRTLTLEDTRNPFALDLETIAQIFYIRSAAPHLVGQFPYCPHCRNHIQNYDSCPYCTQGRSINESERKALLEKIFKAEFDSMTPEEDHIDPPLPPMPSFEQAEIQSNADGLVSSVPPPPSRFKKKKKKK